MWRTKMKKNITEPEYRKAQQIVAIYEYQCKPQKVHVSVTYQAEVSVDIVFPAEMSVEEIREELTGGPTYLLERDTEDAIQYGEITELIVNGEEIKL
jgi:hypothetical protein